MNVIDRARERIERGGWHQGGYGDFAGDGPVCVMGALNWLRLADRSIDRSDFHNATRAIQHEIDYVIPVWNDDPSTTLEDVLLVMKRASARLDEETR